MTTDAVPDPEAGSRPGERRRRRAEAVAAAIRADAEETKRSHVRRAARRLDAGEGCALGDEQRAAVEALADAIVEGVLGGPVGRVRAGRADPTAVDAAVRLFDPDLGRVDGPGNVATDGRGVDDGD